MAERAENLGVSPTGGDTSVVSAIRQFREEAEQARKTRIRKNRANIASYMGLQDWKGKVEGQSTEFIPKLAMAAEQFAAFIRRAITQVGDDWYTFDLPAKTQQIMKNEQARDLLNCFLRDIPKGLKTTNIATILGDGAKVGILESLIILKIHGRTFDEHVFVAEPGEAFFNSDTGEVEQEDDKLVTQPWSRWRLQIDLIRTEDYYPDPTGRGLYEIHRVERDLHEVVTEANRENGMYDRAMVAKIEEDFKREEEDTRRASLVGHDPSTPPRFRRRVVLDEFWGCMLDEDGKIMHNNVVATVANDKHLIRKPEPNPMWHQESPFVAEPLIRVPFSVWHKAIADHATPLGAAINELTNLMIDGAIAAVWGIKQLRIDGLEDPRQVSGGIPQGETLMVNSTLPPGVKVLERVDSGVVPPDAMAILGELNREFLASAFTNEIRTGSLPPREVKATEVIEASQSQAAVLDAISTDLENNLIGPMLRKAFLTILQNAGDLDSDQIISAVGLKLAFTLSQMTPADRYASFAKPCQIKVSGLSQTLARVRDFQKTMALMQSVMANPLLFRAFMQRFSADRTLTTLMKQLNINPQSIEKTDEEKQQAQQEAQEVAQVSEMLNPRRKGGATDQSAQGGSGPSAQQTGDASTPAEINQEANPMTGASL